MYKIISVGGSIVIPKTGFDIAFLKKFREMILRRVEAGDKFVLVVGGGATCRTYQGAAREVVAPTGLELDWLGINATKFNAEFVKLLFRGVAHDKVLVNASRKIKTNASVIIASGWKPGCSTDTDTVILAHTYGAKEIINASNIDYVYTADPKKDANAKPFKQMTWAELRAIVGNKWVAGTNTPFDPTAAKKAQKLGLKAYFVKGTDLVEFEKILSGQIHRGTVVV